MNQKIVKNVPVECQETIFVYGKSFLTIETKELKDPWKKIKLLGEKFFFSEIILI